MPDDSPEFRLDTTPVERATAQRRNQVLLRSLAVVAAAVVVAVAAGVAINSAGDDTSYQGTSGAAVETEDDSTDLTGSPSDDVTGSDDAGGDDSTGEQYDTEDPAAGGAAGEGDVGADVGSADDPLGVGAPFENVGCTGQAMLLLRSSGDPATYASVLGDAISWTSDVKYLRTNQSCSTFNQQIDGNDIYAAYTGPYDSLSEACQARLDVGHVEAVPRMMDEAAEHRSYCACDAMAMPTYSIAEDYDPGLEDQMNISEAQSMLYFAGFNPSQATGGHFREQTQAMVTAFQADRGLETTGELDDATWSALLDEEC